MIIPLLRRGNISLLKRGNEGPDQRIVRDTYSLRESLSNNCKVPALPYVAYHEWTSTQRPTTQWHMRYAGVRFRSRWRLQFRLWFEWKSTYLDACTVLLSKRRWITYRPCSFSVLGYITLSIIDRVTWYARCPYLDMAGTRSFPTRLLYQRTISKAGENDWIEAMSPERKWTIDC